MKNPAFIYIVFFLITAALSARGTEEGTAPAYEEFPEALGFQYGEISGTGLSYQSWNGSLGLQYAAGILYSPFDEDSWYTDNTLDYAVGAEAQFRVFGEDFSDWLSGQLYTFVGLGHRGYIPVVLVSESQQIGETDTWTDAVYAVGSYTPTIGLGAGIGIELILFRHFSVPIELGYGLTWGPTLGSLDKQFTVNLYPQVGFRYRY